MMETKTKFWLVEQKMGSLKKWGPKDSIKFDCERGERGKEERRERENFIYFFRLGRLWKPKGNSHAEEREDGSEGAMNNFCKMEVDAICKKKWRVWHGGSSFWSLYVFVLSHDSYPWEWWYTRVHLYCLMTFPKESYTVDQLSLKFKFSTCNCAFSHSGEIQERTSFLQMLTDSSHMLALSMDKRICFPLTLLTAQDFGMVVCMRQVTFLTLDVEWLYFLTHSWTTECFSQAGPVTYRWPWQIQ